MLALKINVAMSNAGVKPAGFGSLQLFDTGTSLDGRTVAEILAAAGAALGGKGLPSDYTFGSLNQLITDLNEAFDNGNTVSPFATAHLRK